MRKWLVPVLMPLAGVAVFLLGLVALGKLARDNLRNREHGTIAFADIDCEPPPGQERTDFLDEVQYLASLPERLRLLDDDLAERLAEAFARHPRVAEVEQVRVVLPRQVQVRLRYRPPGAAPPTRRTSPTRSSSAP